MYKDSVPQEIERLKAMLKRAKDDVARLREERAQLDPDSLDFVWVDEALFEARCEVRRAEAALKMAGSHFICERCGESYNSEWVAAYGLRCDVECDGQLRRV